MVVRTDVFRSAGGFDERYFMFFEDVDFGWRLWLLGWRVRYVPHSLVFHRHHASMAQVRELARALPARAQRALHDLQELRRRQPRPACCRPRWRCRCGAGSRSAASTRTRSTSSAACRGEADDRSRCPSRRSRRCSPSTRFVENMAIVRRTRATSSSARRQRGDHEITQLFRLPLHPNIDEPVVHGRVHRRGRGHEHRPGRFAPRARSLVATGDIAHAAHGRPGDPGVADRAGARVASTTSSSCRR